MEQFISIIVFSVPGLLVYFWCQSFGLNPTTKHNSTELIAISALFWIPTVIVILAIYNAGYFLIDKLCRALGLNFDFGLSFVKDLSGIQEHGVNLYFIGIFFILSIIISFIVAKVWVKLFSFVLNRINKIRLENNLSELSDTSSVWDAFFLKLENKKPTPMVVEVYMMGNDEKKIAGSITKMSRPYEPGRALVLEKVDELSASHNYYKYTVTKSYIDVKSGMIISQIDLNNPTENQADFKAENDKS